MNRRIMLWSSATLAIVLLIIGATLVWPRLFDAPTDASSAGQSTPGSEPPALPTVAAPTPASTASPGAVDSDAVKLVIPFVSAEAASRTDITKAVDFRDVATGAALDDLRVNATAMVENGQLQIGSPKVVSATVTEIDTSGTPPTATALICLDYSEVDVKATDGTSVKDSSAAQRVQSVLTLNEIGGHWLVTKRTFPDNPTC